MPSMKEQMEARKKLLVNIVKEFLNLVVSIIYMATDLTTRAVF